MTLRWFPIQIVFVGAVKFSRHFLMGVFNEFTSYLDGKIEIMQLNATETRPDPLPCGPSAIRGVARYRGATIGVECAEAFSLVRELT